MRLTHFKYDIILYIITSLLIFGLIGNGVQPVRLFIVALAPFMIRDAFKGPHKSLYYYRFEILFLIFWWLWAISFYYKAVDPIEGLKHLIFLLIHILGFFETIWAANKAQSPQKAIKFGWVTIVILSIPIAIYEFLTGFHLPMTVHDTVSNIVVNGIHIERPYASVTFGNLNSYNTMLCWCLPSLFMCNIYPRNMIEQSLGFILTCLTSLIIIANASRGAILCLAITVLVYIYIYYKLGRNRFLFSIFLAFALGLLIYHLGDLFTLIIERFNDQGVNDDGRTENLIQGFKAFLDSYGLGIGIANYTPIMVDIYRVEFGAPHNLFLEVLVCFGLPIAIGFIAMYLRITYICFSRGTSFNHNMFLFCFVVTIFAGIIDSSYLMKVPTWIFLASIYIYRPTFQPCET